MAGAPLPEFYVTMPKFVTPEFSYVMANPEITHKTSVSKCGFLTRTRLHENCVVTQNSICQDFFYVCNVFDGEGARVVRK